MMILCRLVAETGSTDAEDGPKKSLFIVPGFGDALREVAALEAALGSNTLVKLKFRINRDMTALILQIYITAVIC